MAYYNAQPKNIGQFGINMLGGLKVTTPALQAPAYQAPTYPMSQLSAMVPDLLGKASPAVQAKYANHSVPTPDPGQWDAGTLAWIEKKKAELSSYRPPGFMVGGLFRDTPPGFEPTGDSKLDNFRLHQMLKGVSPRDLGIYTNAGVNSLKDDEKLLNRWPGKGGFLADIMPMLATAGLGFLAGPAAGALAGATFGSKGSIQSAFKGGAGGAIAGTALPQALKAGATMTIGDYAKLFSK